MSDRKISDLTALTTLATGDLFVVADVSETGDDANKKITKANLMTDIFTSPTLVTPNIGAATGTTLNLTGDSNQIVLDSDGTSTTITDSATSARVITLPDLTTTLVGTSETSVTDNRIVRMDGTTGQLIQQSGALLSDGGVGTFAGVTTTSSGSTGMLVASGTISSLGFAFSADTDSGLYRVGANNWALVAGGTDVVRLNTATTAVNYVDITPSAAGAAVTIATGGSDTDIGITINPKGAGVTTISGAGTITGTTTLATSLTGVLRADSGVVSVDTLNTGYALIGAHSGVTAPADATNYYIGQGNFVSSSTEGIHRVYVPKAGTIRAAYVTFINSGTSGASSETSSIYIRLNATTDTLVSSAVQNDTASITPFVVSNTSLSIAVAQGDFFEFKWTTPTWVTNPTPTALIVHWSVYIS